jgi:hypothetical protein
MKPSRFTVRKRTDRTRPPKFGLTNAMLQGRKRVLKHHHRSQSPRKTTLRRYNVARPMGDYDIPSQETKFGLTNAMLKGRRRVLTHHHRSKSPRRATLKRYNVARPMGDYDIVNTPRQRGQFREMDIEPINRMSSSSSSRRKSRK